MSIFFEGRYKSLTTFSWTDIPDFVVISGPNGTGKSQLLDLIYNSIILITPYDTYCDKSLMWRN